MILTSLTHDMSIPTLEYLGWRLHVLQTDGALEVLAEQTVDLGKEEGRRRSGQVGAGQRSSTCVGNILLTVVYLGCGQGKLGKKC